MRFVSMTRCPIISDDGYSTKARASLDYERVEQRVVARVIVRYCSLQILPRDQSAPPADVIIRQTSTVYNTITR